MVNWEDSEQSYLGRKSQMIAEWYWDSYGFSGGSAVKNLPAMHETWQETQVWSLGQEDPLEKKMAAWASILAWRNPWAEEPGGLQSLASQRVGHNLVIEHGHALKLLE